MFFLHLLGRPKYLSISCQLSVYKAAANLISEVRYQRRIYVSAHKSGNCYPLPTLSFHLARLQLGIHPGAAIDCLLDYRRCQTRAQIHSKHIFPNPSAI